MADSDEKRIGANGVYTAPWKSEAYWNREQTQRGQRINDVLDRIDSFRSHVRNLSFKEDSWDRIDQRLKAEWRAEGPVSVSDARELAASRREHEPKQRPELDASVQRADNAQIPFHPMDYDRQQALSLIRAAHDTLQASERTPDNPVLREGALIIQETVNQDPKAMEILGYLPWGHTPGKGIFVDVNNAGKPIYLRSTDLANVLRQHEKGIESPDARQVVTNDNLSRFDHTRIEQQLNRDWRNAPEPEANRISARDQAERASFREAAWASASSSTASVRRDDTQTAQQTLRL